MVNLAAWSGAIPVLQELARSGIPVIVLKSLPQVEELYGDAGGRSTGDVDLLVPAGRAWSAIELLLNTGWTLEDSEGFAGLASLVGTQRAAARRPWHLLAPATSGGPGIVDIHSDGMSPWRDPPLSSDIWERAVPKELDGTCFLALGAEDRLLYVCWHFVREGLSWRKISDIQTILACEQDMDWTWLAERARRTGMVTAVRLVCEAALVRSSRPFEPRWRAYLPRTTRVRTAVLSRMLGARRDVPGGQTSMLLGTFAYDRWRTVLEVLRIAVLPGSRDLAGTGSGYAPGHESYLRALARLYRSRVRQLG